MMNMKDKMLFSPKFVTVPFVTKYNTTFLPFNNKVLEKFLIGVYEFCYFMQKLNLWPFLRKAIGKGNLLKVLALFLKILLPIFLNAQ